MRMKFGLLCVFLSAALFCASAAFASDDVAIHGLVSQGFLKSSSNNHLANTNDGTFEFNEFIVNIQKQMDDKLHLGMQLISTDLGPEGNNKVKIDWAYGDYRINDNFGVRLGRVKAPFGLYNKYRDIDMLRTTVLLPGTIYMENFRQFVTAINGGSIYGTVQAGKGSLDFEFCYGGSDFDADSNFAKDVLARVHGRYEAGLTSRLPAALQAAGLKYQHAVEPSRSSDSKKAFAGTLIWNTPVEGLRFAASRFETAAKMKEDLLFQPLINPSTNTIISAGFTSTITAGYRFKSVDVGSFEYNHKRFTFAGEFMAANGKLSTGAQANVPGSPLMKGYNTQTTQGDYLQVIYRYNDKQAWSAYHGRYFFDRSDKDGKNAVAAGNPAWTAYQKDTCLSYKHNINPNWSIKIENHWMNGTALVSTTLNPKGNYKKNWNLFAIKATYNF